MAPSTDPGLVIPARFSFARLLSSPRFAPQTRLLQQTGAEAPDYAEQVKVVPRSLTSPVPVDEADDHAMPG